MGATLMNWGRAPTTLRSLNAIGVEGGHGVDDVFLLLRRQLGIDGDRHHFQRRTPRLLAVLRAIAELLEALLHVQRDRIVDLGPDAGAGQVAPEVVTPGRAQDVLMEDVAVAVDD